MYTSIYRSVAAASRPTKLRAMLRRSYGERPLLISRISADPTTTPSASGANARTWSGVATPKPIVVGTSPAARRTSSAARQRGRDAVDFLGRAVRDEEAVDARGDGVTRDLFPAVLDEGAVIAHEDDRHGQAFFARRHDVGETLRQIDVLLPRDVKLRFLGTGVRSMKALWPVEEQRAAPLEDAGVQWAAAVGSPPRREPRVRDTKVQVYRYEVCA